MVLCWENDLGIGKHFSVLTVRGMRREFEKKMAAVVDEECELCFDVVAVLPAGGSGVRMNIQLPKQVQKLQLLKNYSICHRCQTTVIYCH